MKFFKKYCVLIVFGILLLTGFYQNGVLAGTFISPAYSGKSSGCDYGGTGCFVKGEYHTGIDYIGKGDKTVIASNSGRVAVIIRDGDGDHGFGNTVVLEHWLISGGIIYSQYSHLDYIEEEIVEKNNYYTSNDWSKNQWVSRGDTIGIMGASGYGERYYWGSDNIHLHFEMKRKWTFGEFGYSARHPDTYGYYLNPNDFIGNDSFDVMSHVCILGVYFVYDSQVKGVTYSFDRPDDEVLVNLPFDGDYSDLDDSSSSGGPDGNIKYVWVSKRGSDDKMHEVNFFSSTKPQYFDIWVKINNKGDEEARDFKIKCYMSTDKDFDEDKDIYLGSDRVNSLAAGESLTERKISILVPVAPGTYYIFCRIGSLDEDVNPDNDISSDTDKEEYAKIVVNPNLSWLPAVIDFILKGEK